MQAKSISTSDRVRRLRGTGAVYEYTKPNGSHYWKAVANLGLVDGKRQRKAFVGQSREAVEKKLQHFLLSPILRCTCYNCPIHKRARPKLIRKPIKPRTTPLRLRLKILQRDKYHCQLCGRGAEHGAILEVDHKVAWAKGGATNEANLWVLCYECNRGKLAKDLVNLPEKIAGATVGATDPIGESL